jgi:hypothetical protein
MSYLEADVPKRETKSISMNAQEFNRCRSGPTRFTRVTCDFRMFNMWFYSRPIVFMADPVAWLPIGFTFSTNQQARSR